MLNRPKLLTRLAAMDRLQAALEYELGTEPVIISEEIRACRDPRDDKFLEVAVAGGADLILTGDADLLVLHPFRGIAILTPAAYLAGLDFE